MQVDTEPLQLGGLGTWVTHLDADHSLEDHLVDRNVLRLGVATVGAGAIRWALRAASENAAQIIGDVPGLGGEGQLVLIRRGAELSAILTLLGIAGVGVDESSPTEERAVITELVHRRVPADVVWQGSRRSHDLLMRVLFDACDRWVQPDRLAEEIRHVASTALQVYNGLAIRSAEHYAEESRRWLSSELAVRDEIVRHLLEEKGDRDPELLLPQLPYAVLGRQHLGVIVWREAQGRVPDGELTRLATDWLSARGAQQVLVLPQGRSLVRVWGNRRGAWEGTGGDSAQLPRPAGLPSNVRLAHGNPGADLAGFRRTHAEAARTHGLAVALPGLDGPVLDHREFELLSLLVADRDRAERFADEELGLLAASDPRTAELRRTLRLYLECHSPKQVAEQLFVARNTVGYRLQQAEDLLGRPLGTRTTELACALMLAEALGDPSG